MLTIAFLSFFIYIEIIEGEELLCYIHRVSPLKQSNNTAYFTAELQTSPKHVVRAVSFSPKKRSSFCKFEEEKSPVKISKFKISSRDSKDVIINNNTAITLTQVPFKCKEICSSSVSTISSLQNVSLEQLVNLHAFVSQLSAAKVISCISGPLKKQEGVLVDETSSIKVVLWESHVDQLQQGDTYILSNLRLKECRGEKYVNTPKTGEFAFKAVEKLANLADHDHIELETIHTKTATIVGINSVTKSLSCVGCKGKAEVDVNSKFAVCSTCKMQQKTSACRCKWFASILIQCEDNSSSNIRFPFSIYEVNQPNNLFTQSCYCLNGRSM